MLLNKIRNWLYSKAQNLGLHHEKYGLRRTILKCLIYFVYNRNTVIFYQLKLNDIVLPHQQQNSNIEVARIKKENLEKFKYLGGGIGIKEAKRRVEKGQVLHAALNGISIISQQWSEFKEVDLDFIGLRLNLPDDIGYISNIYTAPDYRSRGLATITESFALRNLRDAGYKRALVVVEKENMASQTINEKLGFKPYQTVWYRRLLFIKFYCVKDYHSGQMKRVRFFNSSDQKLWNAFKRIKDS